MKIRESGVYKKTLSILSVIAEKRLDTYSAAAAFYIFMSFIPYTLILLCVIKYLPFTKQDLMTFINGVLPVDLNELIVYVIDELYNRGIGILSISVIAAVWASAKGVLGITKGLNEITGAKPSGNYIYLRARSAICTLLLMVGMVLMVVIAVFGKSIAGIVNRYIAIPPAIIRLIAAKDMIMWVVLFVIYMFLFCVLPAKKIRIRSQIPGAALSSLVWVLFTKLFSFYLSTFNGYSMYGSFAVILVLGIWLYAGMYIMFMGALMNEISASGKG